ncbi:CopG family ribbon-helix-helix protein [Natribacillus halophilus]|uniref:CopG family transcriptional regulator / antitoxin EndoAI n=1 Tax=Natribacillus halophilus TaxID=549003 RepID=A0A1G8QJ10_9BACI|nr:CopG family transcriptional regulator / antitoxin EndoAI [Natribacillus halophilus]
MSQDSASHIMISLPNYLLREVDRMTKRDGLNRSDFLHQAATKYLHERKEIVRESMQQGYVEMASINLNIATESFELEEEAESWVDYRNIGGAQL